MAPGEKVALWSSPGSPVSKAGGSDGLLRKWHRWASKELAGYPDMELLLGCWSLPDCSPKSQRPGINLSAQKLVSTRKKSLETRSVVLLRGLRGLGHPVQGRMCGPDLAQGCRRGASPYLQKPHVPLQADRFSLGMELQFTKPRG